VKIPAILVAGLVALGSSSALAEPLRPIFGGNVLAPFEVNGIVRSMGLVPTSRPVREGLTYAVLAADPRGRPVRVIVDARFGDVLSVRRVVVAGPPGAYPEPPRVYGVPPRPYAPYEMPWMGPDFRPPGLIGRADPYLPYPPVPRSRPATSHGDKPEQKAAAAPASPRRSVVTIGPSAASRAADPKPTGSTPKPPSFPPVQSLE
jgi:hypothetical protein